MYICEVHEKDPWQHWCKGCIEAQLRNQISHLTSEYDELLLRYRGELEHDEPYIPLHVVNSD